MHHLEKANRGLVTEIEFSSEFEKDVFLGLSDSPKWLSSKYFYDEKGDRIFQEIMHMDEYYLTNAEMDIFVRQKEEIRNSFQTSESFRLIELGAGDGSKTKILLEHFVKSKVDFKYIPVDISGNVLNILKESLLNDLSDLKIEPREGDYFHVLSDLSINSDQRNIIFFLGSNIGNFSYPVALDFLKSIRSNLHPGDMLMLGVDLKKDPQRILSAYNDRNGITRRFNLNLLERINEELGSDFDIEQFMHYPVYDPVSGECRSYLLSKEDQKVTIRSVDQTFEFYKWEPVFMEVSRKYDLKELMDIAKTCGFMITRNFLQEEFRFVDSLWTAI